MAVIIQHKELEIQLKDKNVQDKKLLPINPNKRDIYSAGDLNQLGSLSVNDIKVIIETLECNNWFEGYFSKQRIEK